MKKLKTALSITGVSCVLIAFGFLGIVMINIVTTIAQHTHHGLIELTENARLSMLTQLIAVGFGLVVTTVPKTQQRNMDHFEETFLLG